MPAFEWAVHHKKYNILCKVIEHPRFIVPNEVADPQAYCYLRGHGFVPPKGGLPKFVRAKLKNARYWDARTRESVLAFMLCARRLGCNLGDELVETVLKYVI